MVQTEMILAAITEVKADIKSDLTEIKEHLAVLNGRTRKTETGLAIHWVLWGLLGASMLASVPILVEHLKWIS